MAQNFTVQVESGRAGQNGSPSIGPVYRSALAKNGFPPLDPDMTSSWDVFRVAAEKFASNRMLGWREMKNGKAGPYQWKTYKEIYEQVLQVGSALTHLAIISFTSTTVEQNAAVAAANSSMKLYNWKEFLQMGKEYPSEPLPPKPLDICTIMYTSGTSGNPKGVMLTHESLAAYVNGVDLFMKQFEDKMTTDDVYLSFLPLAHILDRTIEEYFFHNGASVGYFQGDIHALRDDLMELKPTFFAGVPRVFERVHEGVRKALSELRPHRRMIFHALYKHKLNWMKSGYSHKTASPFADFLAFRKVKARLGGRIRLMISGGAPLNPPPYLQF